MPQTVTNGYFIYVPHHIIIYILEAGRCGMKLKTIGAGVAKSLIFCGLAAVLASSIYMSIQTIVSADYGEGGTVRDTEPQKASEAEKSTKENTSGASSPEESGYVALTFDDGPHPVYTKMLLDGLAERQIKATFFVIGSNIPGNEDLILRMYQEGHLIGNHTYDHVKICDLSGADACAQLEKTSALVREITGEDTEFIRPPFGAWNKSMECSFTMLPVLWDVDPLDWTTKNTSLVVQRVLDDVENGDIILLHDCYKSSVDAALQIVDTMQSQGYEFVTVDEMILE